MASHPIPAGVRGTCPCCGSTDRFLFTCKQCNWLAVPPAERGEAKERLDQFSPSYGLKAFNPRGCYVCETCSAQMSTNPMACPLPPSARRVMLSVPNGRPGSQSAIGRKPRRFTGAGWWITS
jgi:hypothetical protein